MLGIYVNDEYSRNKLSISVTLLVFQFEISGIFFNDEHLKKFLISYKTITK
jgi:hypothetical protein